MRNHTEKRRDVLQCRWIAVLSSAGAGRGSAAPGGLNCCQVALLPLFTTPPRSVLYSRVTFISHECLHHVPTQDLQTVAFRYNPPAGDIKSGTIRVEIEFAALPVVTDVTKSLTSGDKTRSSRWKPPRGHSSLS